MRGAAFATVRDPYAKGLLEKMIGVEFGHGFPNFQGQCVHYFIFEREIIIVQSAISKTLMGVRCLEYAGKVGYTNLEREGEGLRIEIVG